MMIGPKVTAAIFGAVLLIAAYPAEAKTQSAELSVMGLTCEYAVNPLGIDVAAPGG